MSLLARWVIVAVSLFAAAYVVPGITVEGDALVVLAATAVIVGLVNALIRPVLVLLSCPLVILTLGLFTLVINAVCLLLASWLAQNVFHLGFRVDGFWAAFLGSIVVSVVSIVLSTVLGDGDD